MMRSYNGSIHGAAAVALLALVAGCGDGPDDSNGFGGGPGGPGGFDGEAREIPVAAEVVEPRDLEVTLRGSTNLRAREEVQVLPKQQGVVAEIHVEEGDVVSEGQVLARMDDEEWRYEARRAEARADAARRQAERAAVLQERGLMTDQEAEGLKADAEVAESDYELAQLRVRNARITAPVDGIVTHRFIERGQLLSASEAVFTVVDDRVLEARVAVPERQANRVEEGQAVRVEAGGANADPVMGEVARIRPVVDPESGTVQVTVQLDPDVSPEIRPGRFVNVDIVTEAIEGRVAIPRTAVLADGTTPRAFVIRDGRAQEVELELGFSQRNRVEVRSGLEPGDTIVTVGQNNLRSDNPVRIMELDGEVLEGDGMPETEAPETPGEGELPGEEVPEELQQVPDEPPADGADSEGGSEAGDRGVESSAR